MNVSLFNAYSSIKKHTPGYVKDSIHKLIPLAILSSIFDVFGLFIIVPVINIILDSSIIYQNQYLLFLYERIGVGSELKFAVVLLGFIFLFFLLKNVIAFFISERQAVLAYDVAGRLTVDQFDTFLTKPYQFHTTNQQGDILRRIIDIPYNFVMGILMPFVVILNEILAAFLIALAILAYNPLLFLSILFFIVPLFFLYIYLQRKKLRHISVLSDASHSEMFSKGKQGLEGFREIILFDKIDYFKPKFEESVKNYNKANSALYLLNSFSPRVVEGIAVLSIFVIFLSGIMLDYNLSKVASFLGAFSLAAYKLIPSINKLILNYNVLKASEFVFNHFDKNPINKSKEEEELKFNAKDDLENLPLTFRDKIEFENVSFNYSAGSSQILNQVSLTIRKGETIGIIGESGSGKSTLLNVFLMLLEQSEGTVKIDNVKLTNALKPRWYKTISYVPQNVIIVSGTLQENIAFGVPESEVDKGRLEVAIEKSQLKSMIDMLPAGLNTRIEENGMSISGGQKQRIGIARALYHNGPILIFDEATSSLDHETEKLLTESIKILSDQNYTIIIVAHRLETLKYCDKIYKLESGEVGQSICFNEMEVSR